MGVVQSLRAGVDVTTVDGSTHTLPLAPAASQEAIKQLGTNGGGIFNANSAHPFENPTALTNLVEIFLMLVDPGGPDPHVRRDGPRHPAGHRAGRRHGRDLGGVHGAAWLAESHPNGPAALAAGAAMEGKEVRFGIPGSALFAVSTTGTSTGAVNSLHDSFTGAGGGIALLNMLLGEVAPGGVGAGLYGILVLAIIAVFLAGLMVGRTPEYLGKKLGRREVTFAAISILVMPALVLLGAGLAIALPGTADALNNDGAHGFSEVLYAYASAANNNGSAFAGITVTSDFFQASLGVAMLFGRFVPILAVLALAGSLARQRRVQPAAGTLPTDGPLFATLVGGTVLLVSALTFFPALALGPDRGGVVMTAAVQEKPAVVPVAAGAFRPHQVVAALPEALRKLDPRTQLRNPVMFVVWVGSVLVTVLADRGPQRVRDPDRGVAVVHRRCSRTWPRRSPRAAGKAQAESLRRTKRETVARRLLARRLRRSGSRGRP